MRKALRLVPASLLFMGFSHCALADTDWSLTATFSDGAVASGVFVTNSAGTVLESWNISVTGGLGVHDFVSSSANGVSTSNNFGQMTTVRNPVSWPAGTVEALEFADFSENAYAVFYLGEILTGDPITIAGALDCGANSSCGTLTRGSIVDPPLSAVPEPVSIILLGSGAVFISLAMRRRSK